MRIVSLLPSATEIVYALGLADQLVGVTFECDEPPQARRDNAVVVGGRDTSGMTPREIDDYVRGRAAAGEDLYHLEHDALRGLAPELVLTQDLCWVCAVPSATVNEALAHLGCDSEVVTLDPYSLGDVLATIEAVAGAAGVSERGAELVMSLRDRLAAVAAAVRGRACPRVAVVEWLDPPFAAGHWIPDLVTAAGGTPVAARAGKRSVPVTWDEIADARPDVVVVTPCGYHLDGAAEQAELAVAALPGVPVWAIDGDALIVRPGPRVVDGVEALAAILHPAAAAQLPDRSGAVRCVTGAVAIT
ncbi:ABC transporter substrate-binding protein [uncultured Jatrophihabitans sp.]|uniref:ABC transporter substrate-binding protein n=1 Tax=uncultured Jatrophihabitans sp. TaxID=1610747 RepID=UPI0035CA4465